MKNLVYISLSLFLFSCVDLKKSERIEKIEKIRIKLSQKNQQIEPEQFDSLTLVLEASVNTQAEIKSLLLEDTLTLSNAIKIDELKQVQIQLKTLKSNIPTLNREINKRSQALKKLKFDIENTSGKRSRYDEYIEKENEYALKAISKIDSCIQLYNSTKETFNTIYPELKQYIEELKKKNQLLLNANTL